ncbi:MAG: protein BatD [Bacteroidaceae bacterium]|nr:protein BatD [Bacteroidaceae bacterium]
MKRTLLTIIATLATLATIYADEVSFVVSAPNAVVVDQHFRLSYTVNRGNVKEPRIPSFDGFEILSGPNRSTSQSWQNINGEVTQSYTVTFNYILSPTKEGTFEIPAATIEVDGKQYTSNTTTIKVLPADKTSQTSQGQGRRESSNSRSVNIAKDELFMTATLNKTNVFEQEAVLLTYKIYSLVNLTNLNGKLPELKGFQIQEVDLPQNKEWQLEHYNGRNYRTIVWSRFVLFPQQSGKIEIPSVKYEGTVAVQSGARMDAFDFFMNGGPRYVEVKKELRTPALTLNVKALPQGKPADFSGAVGKFSASGTISTTELKANEAVTVRLVISGTGNMKLIKTPEVQFPEDFEVYDPKIDNVFKLTTAGFQGNKVIEYLAIPRHGGDYTIPPINFSYLDVETGEYKTVETGGYTLKVAKGKESDAAAVASYVSKEELKLLGSDIRYMKTGNVTLSKPGSHLFASSTYWLWYIIPLLCFVGYILLHRKQMAENANVAKMRTKKANKVAVKRLKVAQKLLKENKKNEFYDEILRALWGYLSDKLSIPVSRLNKDNVASELLSKGVSEEIVKDLEAVLGESEFARYAPGNPGAAMDNVYTMSMNVISKMENTIKK